MLLHVLLFLTMLLPSLASITPVSTTSSTLLSFGSAHTTQTYIVETSNQITAITLGAPTIGYRPILSNVSSSSALVQEGVYNVTVDMYFEAWVGNFDYAVVVDTISSEGATQSFTHVATHAVYGLVLFRSDNTIVSGDEAEGISFDHFLTDGDEGKTVEVMTYAPDGVDMTPVFTTRDTFSPGSTLLGEDAVTLRDGMLTIRPRDLTSGSAVVNIVCPGLETEGEVYESVVMVSVSGPDGPVVLREATAMVVDDETVIEAFVWNGGEKVVLMIDGNKLAGEKVAEEVFRFSGAVNDGNHENLRIFKEGVEGIVKKGLVIEVLRKKKEGGKKGDKKKDKKDKKGKKVKWNNVATGFIVMLVLLGVVIAIAGIVGCVAYRRGRRKERKFIDGRPEHIARDVYGRGSLEV